MAYQLAEPSAALGSLELQRRQEISAAKERQLNQPSFLNELLGALQSGVKMASDITGVAANMQKIEESRQNVLGNQAQLQAQQNALAQSQRLVRGEFQSPQELAAQGGRVVTDVKKILPGEIVLPGKLAGKDIQYAKLDKDRAQVEQEQMKISETKQARIGKQQEEASKKAQEITKKSFDDLVSLRKERSGDKIIQNATESVTGFDRLQAAASEAKRIMDNPQLSEGEKNQRLLVLTDKAIVAATQIDEPGLSVKESDFDRQNPTGIFTKTMNSILGTYSFGRALSPVQLDQLLKAGEASAAQRAKAAEIVDQGYELSAQRLKRENPSINLNEVPFYNYRINGQEPNVAQGAVKEGPKKVANVNEPVSRQDYAKAMDWVYKDKLAVGQKQVPSIQSNKPQMKKTGPGILGAR